MLQGHPAVMAILARLTLQLENSKEERYNRFYFQVLTYDVECSEESHRIWMKLRRG
ncbi:hypothetical protein A2U01_0118210 [Trifolium medium]|uniref:Uncharacterized protein n=1 Tax=Trifolium medium TaxID=97028 RepID=A0A392WE99_9FABA|nr:hypothetical protein [Trifolium medium]